MFRNKYLELLTKTYPAVIFTMYVPVILIYVKATDIAYVQIPKGITWAITYAGQKWPLDYTLDQIEKMLDRHSFFLINRQFIIHVDAIKKTTYYNSRLILQLQPAAETDVLISRNRMATFKSWLKGRPVS